MSELDMSLRRAGGAPVLCETPELASPPPVMGLAPLFRAALAREDITGFAPDLIARYERNDDVYALLDLALIQQLCFQREDGLATLGVALARQQVFRVAQGKPGAIRLLVVKTPGDFTANVPFECILEHAGITIDVLYVGPGLSWPARVPDHDLLFVAIGEADTHCETLAQLGRYLENWPRPVLNPPGRIPALSRAEAFEVLRGAPGLCMATTWRMDRAALASVQPGEIAFPIILRPQGAHGGINLSKIENTADIAAYLEKVEGNDFFAANFINYASPDGLFRKYRVVLIDGKPFLAHMGISQHWMVHYPYPEMKEYPERRAEEAAAMAGFDEGFASRHAAALAAIHERFGLDYVGFDCAETQQGELLVFELSNALVIHDADDTALFPYKSPQMRRIFEAFCDMLNRRARAAAR
ncbi:MAG: hypothetical protein LKE96_04935 [Acetobacter peroxydans]|jgi:glutathione synthase/RimK-type ligase-like ATP-grasp enzyme|nr:hypothetical protein [Acetobacter peroxydans]